MPDASRHEFKPDWTMHPGVMLREWLDFAKVPAHLFASVSGIDRDFFDRLLAFDPAVTIDEKLADHIFHGTQLCGIGPSPQFWLNSERNYREALERGAADTSSDFVDLDEAAEDVVEEDELETAARAFYEGPGHRPGDKPWETLSDQDRQVWRDEVDRRRRLRPKEPD